MAKRHRRSRKSTKSAAAKNKLRLRLSLNWIKLPQWWMVRRAVTTAVWLAFVGGLITSWIIFVPSLRARASAAAVASGASIELQFVNAPEWFKHEIAESVARTASLQLSADPLQREDLIAARNALMSTGWFEHVRQVRRIAPDLVSVEAQFVRPHTVIRDQHGDHLVDMEGKLLPKTYRPGEDMPQARAGDGADGAKLPAIAILGAHFPRPQRPGMKWEGADVAAGLALLRLIGRQPWRHQVVAIDVSGCAKNQPIKLRTDVGGTIIWGSAPGEEQALELFADSKLRRLTYMHQTDGRIDLGHPPPGEIDITKSVGVSARQGQQHGSAR